MLLDDWNGYSFQAGKDIAPERPALPAMQYDVMQGVVGELPVGSGPSESCAGSGLADTSLGGLPDPAVDSADYYLVRGSNVCGAGSYGLDSQLQERASGICP